MSTAGQKEVLGAVEIVVGEVINYYDPGAGQWLVQLGISTMVAGGLQELSNLLAPSPMPSAQNGIIRSTVASQQVIYGQVKTGGVVIFSDSYGANNDYLVVGVAHTLTRSTGSAGLAIQGFQGFYVNDVQIPINTGSGGWNSSDGSITSSGVGQPYDPLAGNLWIFPHDGSQTSVDATLNGNFGSYWPTTAIGKGIAYTVFKMFNSSDQATFQAAFPQGIPNMLGCILSGQKVYDPRLDSTNGGTGSQRLGNSSTWTFSSNPALIAADFLVRAKTDGGCGFSTAYINWASIAAAASICDTNITVPAYGATWNGSSWSSTVITAQYTCNLALDTATNVDQNLRLILDTMAGAVVVAGNQIYLYAGASTSSSGPFDETWLAGEIQLTSETARQGRWNAVKATYGQDAQCDYQMQEAAPVYNSTYETQDGGVRLIKSISLPGVTNQFAAQYLEIIESQRSRNRQILTAKCNLKMLTYKCFDVVSVSIAEYGLVSAPFRITSFSLNQDMSVDVVMQSEASGTYTIGSMGLYTAFNPPNLQLLGTTPGPNPPAPTALSVSALVGSNLVQWTPPSPNLYKYIEVWRAPDVSGSPGTYVRIAKVVGDSYEDTSAVQTSGTKYWYIVRSVNYWLEVSAYTTAVSIVGTAVKDMIGGIGSNLMDPLYSVIGTSKVPAYAVHTDLTIGRATSTIVNGYLTLQLTSNSAGSNPVLALTASTSDSTKRGWRQLAKKRYGVQVWGWSVDGDVNGMNFNFRFYNAAGAACTGVAAAVLTGAGGGAKGNYGCVLDLTGATDTMVYLRMEWNGPVAVSKRIDVQDWAIFEMQGTASVQPDFAPPAAATLGDLQDDPDNSGRAATAIGLQANIPTAGNAGTLYHATDAGNNGTTFRDNGTIWVKVGVGHLADADGAATSSLTDDAGLGNMAVFGTVTQTPTTLGGYGITDAQSALPATTDTRHTWFSDAGGAIYEGPVHDTNENFGSINLADQAVSGSTATQYGFDGGFLNPGQSINIHAHASCNANITVGTARPKLRVDYSLDGGSTWVSGKTVICQLNFTNGVGYGALYAEVNDFNVTPSAAVLFRAMGFCVGGAEGANYQNGTLAFTLPPVSNFFIIQPLAVSVPATAAMQCTAYYPTTSCATSKKITVTISGGQAPFTESWAKVSGTGTITAGAATATCTVSDTETTSDAGATHTTTIDCAVTDSQSYTSTAGSQSAGTATITIGAHNIPVGATINASGFTPSNYNGTALVVTGITATAIKYAVAGSPGAVTVQGTINNVTVTSSNCVITGTFYRAYRAISASLATKSGSCWTISSCTANGTATANATGGNQSYTYSHSIVSQSGGMTATLTSGATSQTATYSATGSPPAGSFIQTIVNVKCIVNDSRSTGAVTVTGALTLTANGNA